MSSAVRVLHILPSVHGYGAERLVVELLKHLAPQEIEAALLTIYEPSAEPGDGLPFRHLSAGRRGRRDRTFLWRLVREIRRFRPHIVHTHTHVGKYWGRLAAICAGVSCIVHTEHNPCDSRRSSMETIADRILQRATSRFITFFQEQSLHLGSFEHIPNDKLVVIPNGLAAPDKAIDDRVEVRERLGIRPDQFAIIVVGRMEYQKNHELALYALADLEPEVKAKSRLLFAGAGKNEPALRKLVALLGLEEYVRFLGYRSDVPELLRGANLLLMTSRFEGMPLALVEGMLAGVPVATTPWLGARDMLGDGRFGFIASDFSGAEVAEQIRFAATHPELCNTMAARAADHARNAYDIGRMADSHRRLYAQLSGAAS